MSQAIPTRLDKTARRTLVIEWSDGLSQELTFRQIRNACPCATCGEKQQGKEEEKATRSLNELPILSAAETLPLEIVSMKPVGNYGYNIQFSDGHSTGIYTLDLLRAME